MVTTNDIALFFLVENFLIMICVLIYVWAKRRWKIDITIYRFSGDIKKPILLHRKGRIVVNGNVHMLYVKGYKQPLKDFKSEYYYPGERGAHGSLSLFEFKHGWLTPLIPSIKEIPEDLREEAKSIFSRLRDRGVVKFDFTKIKYDELMLEAIDDTDAEWNLRQQQRIDNQYSGGWRDFLNKYGSHLVILVIAGCLLVGWIVWLKEAPTFNGQCIAAGVEAAKNTYLRDIAAKAQGGGNPFTSTTSTPNPDNPPPPG